MAAIRDGDVMVVRAAASADETGLKACVQETLEATYAGLWRLDPITQWDDDNWPAAQVACIAHKIVGVGLSLEDVVSDLWVHPSAQSKGVGTALLAELEREVSARGYQTARLRCLEPNTKARAFYASK
ncbi:MAG TPA: GNAT family N-acetyltransferase [Caulobacteraceae bacterium]|jgi:GNAT superfamily N-acetyltransferase